MEDLKELSDSLLLQHYANARKTSSCGGHFKGVMNDSFQFAYAEELRSRGIIVPKNQEEEWDDLFNPNVEIPKGVFNGDGSF